MRSEGERDIGAYAGLVFKTAQMFHAQLRLEKEDLEQELWVKVVKARRSYDPARSSMTERAYVYSLIANLVKDLKRDASRRSNGPLEVSYVEDFRSFIDTDGWGRQSLSWFEFTFCHASHDEVYGLVDDGRFVMPATITPGEEEVILLLVLGYAQTEIASQLGLDYAEVVKRTRLIREKLGDWKPSALPGPVPPSPPLKREPRGKRSVVGIAA